MGPLPLPPQAGGEGTIVVRMAAHSELARFAPPVGDRFLGLRITPLTRRRLVAFRRNRRGFWSLWIFLALFLVTLFAEFIANDRPIVLRYEGGWYFPVFVDYPETTFGGEFPTPADYRDPAVEKLISAEGLDGLAADPVQL